MKPEIKTWELTLRNAPFTFRGELLGSATSKKNDHNHPPELPPHLITPAHFTGAASPPDRAYGSVQTAPNTGTATSKPCAACFWTEVKIFRTPQDEQRPRGKYMVYQAGGSSVPGKSTFSRITYTDAYHEVLELLVTRHTHQPPTLTATAARAIAQATAYDEDLEHAWVSRRTP